MNTPHSNDDIAPHATGNLIKICGLSNATTLEAALQFGADLVGLVRFAKSPRHVSIDQAKDLARLTRGIAKSVVLTVDADDAEIDAIMTLIAPDMLQLHGSESPERVYVLKRRYQLPIIKAIGIAKADDLALLPSYRAVSDFLLIDAKPAPGALLPGGNGQVFDWTLLQGLDPTLPIMLSGGLTPDNVAEAIRVTKVASVDVSSGVEIQRGVKDITKIKQFIHNARQAWGAESATPI